MLQSALAIPRSELLLNFCASPCQTDDNATHSAHLQQNGMIINSGDIRGKSYILIESMVRLFQVITHPVSQNNTKRCLFAISSSKLLSVKLITLVRLSNWLLYKPCFPSTNDLIKHTPRRKHASFMAITKVMEQKSSTTSSISLEIQIQKHYYYSNENC